MGLILATIELSSRLDLDEARRGLIDVKDVKKISVKMLVDTGSLYMCINETVRAYLALPFINKKRVQLADGRIMYLDVAGPVEVKFQNRICLSEAVVLPDDNQCLFGAMPMEAMDVLISPARQELVVNPEHPGYGVFRL